MADDPRIVFAFFKNAIFKGDGSSAKITNLNFHFDIVSIVERPAEVGLQMHGGQIDAVGVDDGMILDPQFTDKKLFQMIFSFLDGVWSSNVC